VVAVAFVVTHRMVEQELVGVRVPADVLEQVCDLSSAS
jgi:hypothetical protein